jgi:intraflagellar transport protein 52
MHFYGGQVRLAQLTNKCNDDDLEYYIRECGEILGVTNKLPNEPHAREGKNILEYVLRQIVDFKKAEQE